MDKYLVPDYYKFFRCKGGNCRKTCCQGWDIALSEDEYFRLIGLSCSKELREELDRSLHMVNHPCVEKYGIITFNFFGDCPMHGKDGYCNLQKECGEKILPSICRIYPRSFCSSFDNMACISNSCEKVLEMLFENDNKISFEYTNINFDFKFKKNYNDTVNKHNIQKLCIDILENRDYSLMERFIILEDIINDLDKENFNNVLNKYINKDYINKSENINTYYSIYIQNIIIKYIAKNSVSIQYYLDNIENYYGIDFKNKIDKSHHKIIKQKYKEALMHFKNIFPNYEIMFEKVIINHLFYSSFPFQTDYLEKDYIALLGVYAFMKFFTISFMHDLNNLNDLVDCMGELFRFIEHSNFNKNIDILLLNEIKENKVKIDKILNI